MQRLLAAPSRRFAALFAVLLAPWLSPVLAHADSAAAPGALTAITRGDAAWAKRDDGQSDGKAAAAPIAEAVGAYEEAIAADGKNLEARWKLMRALWFQGEYATATNDGKQKIFDRGKTVGEQAIDLLAEASGGRKAFEVLAPADAAKALAARAEAAPVFFWTAVHWGLWGDAFGKLAAARQGVAGKIRDRCLVASALDETYAEGGPHRVLGRLHSLAPRVPFFTGWINRKTAIDELRTANRLGPEDPLNRLYLAEALREHGEGAGTETEARTILQGVVAHAAVAGRVTEWAAAQARARVLLATDR